MDSYQPVKTTNCVRDNLLTSLLKVGYRGRYLDSLLGEFEQQIAEMPDDVKIPETFFDMERNIRIVSRRELKSPDAIKANLRQHVSDIFYIHDLCVAKRNEDAPFAARRASRFFLPSDIVIVNAAKAYLEHHKKPPASGHDMLPEKSYSWSHIRKELKERTPPISLKQLAADHNVPFKLAFAKRKPMPSDDIITQAAKDYYSENGSLPGPAGYDHLPEKMASWSVILRDLHTRMPPTSLKKFITDQNITLTLDATKVFQNSAKFIQDKTRIPFHMDCIAIGLNSKRLNMLFGRGAVSGWKNLGLEKPVHGYKDFLLATGLACIDENKKIRPATITEVKAAERKFNFV